MSSFSALEPPEVAPPRAENASYSEILRAVNFFLVEFNEADKAHACPGLCLRLVLFSCSVIPY